MEVPMATILSQLNDAQLEGRTHITLRVRISVPVFKALRNVASSHEIEIDEAAEQLIEGALLGHSPIDEGTDDVDAV
jgi:hypothetical protein